MSPVWCVNRNEAWSPFSHGKPVLRARQLGPTPGHDRMRADLPHRRRRSPSIVAQRSARAPVVVQEPAEALVAHDGASRRLLHGLDQLVAEALVVALAVIMLQVLFHGPT